jgi:hypothetical protein
LRSFLTLVTLRLAGKNCLFFDISIFPSKNRTHKQNWFLQNQRTHIQNHQGLSADFCHPAKQSCRFLALVRLKKDQQLPMQERG